MRGRLDRTTQSMLLRQLYLCHFEQERFEDARAIAQQNLELDVLPDVVHQDAARACVGLDDIDAAVGHLRLAARIAPASRRPFHWWTLGAVQHLAGRHRDAATSLRRAVRWASSDRPLYVAHLLAVQHESDEEHSSEPEHDDEPTLDDAMQELEQAPAGRGYGRFVLGLLALYAGKKRIAERYLQAFVQRTAEGRRATAIALDREIERARELLRTLRDR